MKSNYQQAITRAHFNTAGFLGHALPGSAMCGLAIWWAINVIRQHLGALRTDGTPYRTHFFYASALIRQFPLESAAKIVTAIVITVQELRVGIQDGKFINVDMWQHLAIYTSFFVQGVSETVLHRQTLKNKDTDRKLEPVGILVCMSTTAFLFRFHMHGSTKMDIMLHDLLIFTIVVIIACILVETWHIGWATCSMVRVIALQTMGTWLIQISFILYPGFVGLRKWQQSDPTQIQLVLDLYFLHWIGNFCTTLLMAAVIRILSHSPPAITAPDIV